MNEASSRSHSIFRLVIESRSRASDGSVRVATLVDSKFLFFNPRQNLVDLAGSERVGQTGCEGVRLKEGGAINKSLLILGNVISKLSEPSSYPPPPLRT
jgi:centromeric protein E